MMIEEGQLIKLDNNKEYVIVNKLELHNINYVILMTSSKPLEILIATEKFENGNIVLEEIKDNDELDYVLSRLTINNNDENLT